ncbi:MAG: hypothetical protein ACI4Q9_02285 [Candidatus Methanomethylophilaceae archaeon]
MNTIKMGKVEVSIGDLLIYIGALVVIISIFLSYLDATSLGDTASSTGIDVITGKDVDASDLSFVHFAPLFTLIFAIIGAIAAVLPMFTKGIDAKILAFIEVGAFAIAAIFAIVFVAMGAGPDLYVGTARDAIKALIDSGILKQSLGVGAYLGLIASIVGVIGAGINVKENL